MSHVCVANPCSVRNGKVIQSQGRCSICGKFMSKPSQIPVPTFTKQEVIKLLREKTCIIEYNKFGSTYRDMMSLKTEYLGTYVGSGKSKQTDDNTMFLYDVDAERFKRVLVSGLVSISPID